MRDFSIWSENVFPVLRKLHEWGYLRIEVEGLEKIPQQRPFVMVANHGGWCALDGLVIPLALSERVSPEVFPYGIVEDILWKVPVIGSALKRMGSVPRSVARNPDQIPAFVENIGIFPEGSEGNCKPFWQAYQMQPWKTGFARLAHARKACVLPIAVIGLEESLPVLWKVRALKRFLGTVVPIPLLPIPMPTRCKVIFGDPIDICTFSPGPEQDPDFYGRVARHCQERLQAVIDRETTDRPLARLARRVRAGQRAPARAGGRQRAMKRAFHVSLAKYVAALLRMRWPWSRGAARALGRPRPALASRPSPDGTLRQATRVADSDPSRRRRRAEVAD